MESEKINVYEAIARVTAAIGKKGIAKDRKNAQQNYSFRGIDDVYNALSPLLAETGLCILPRVLSRSVSEHATKSGGIAFNVAVEVEFDFVSASDGSRHTVKTFGEAQDFADKATNKAMSAAYKYACFQVFAIPTGGDNDADAGGEEVQARKSVPAEATSSIVASRPALDSNMYGYRTPFELKDECKKRRGRWNKDSKTWEFASPQADWDAAGMRAYPELFADDEAPPPIDDDFAWSDDATN